MCALCVTDRHSNHQSVPLAARTVGARSFVTDAINSLTSQSQTLSQRLRSIQTQIAETKRSSITAAADINTRLRDCLRRVTESALEAKKTVTHISTTATQRLQRQETEVQTAIDAISDLVRGGTACSKRSDLALVRQPELIRSFQWKYSEFTASEPAPRIDLPQISIQSALPAQLFVVSDTSASASGAGVAGTDSGSGASTAAVAAKS